MAKKRIHGAFVMPLLLMVAGSVFLLQPLVANAVLQHNAADKLSDIYRSQEIFASYAHDDFDTAEDTSVLAAQTGQDGDVSDAGEVEEAEGADEAKDKPAELKTIGKRPSRSDASGRSLVRAYDWLKAYNAYVLGVNGSAAFDPFAANSSADRTALAASGYSNVLDGGLEDGLLGVIEIPAMDCTLPLYFGADDAHLAQGAAVVEGSSAPLGETSSNCLIAGHRGWNSLSMFRDIESLSVGDAVVLHTLWADLRYTVRGTRVISPNDASVAAVHDDADMVTLVTCHPYGYNYQRYVVFCVRDGAGADGEIADVISGSEKEGLESRGSEIDEILGNPAFEDALRVSGVVALAVCCIAMARRTRKKEVRK